MIRSRWSMVATTLLRSAAVAIVVVSLASLGWAQVGITRSPSGMPLRGPGVQIPAQINSTFPTGVVSQGNMAGFPVVVTPPVQTTYNGIALVGPWGYGGYGPVYGPPSYGYGYGYPPAVSYFSTNGYPAGVGYSTSTYSSYGFPAFGIGNRGYSRSYGYRAYAW